MDVKDLKKLFDMITGTDITEFKIKTSDEEIIIRRGTVYDQTPVISAPIAQVEPLPAAPPEIVREEAETQVAAHNDSDAVPIKSPIVGTFYNASEPGADPYVEVGQVVEKGQMLCIIEAMKLMNEIEAEFRCRVVKICKENAQAVEYGDPLFIVEAL